jgi:uncharacterized protein
MDILKRVFSSEIKGIDDKEGTLTAYISTDTRDRMDEVLDPEGMDMTNYKKNPVVLWAHDYSQPPIGKALWVKRDGVGIISKVKFASTAFAQEIFQLYKEGFLKAFSVGFIPKDTKEGDGEKQPRCRFTKWELLEYSAVPVPANPDALALAIQKGILKTESIIKSMTPETKEEVLFDSTKEETVIEKKDESIIEETPKDHSETLDELMAENKLLKEQIEGFKKDVSDLNYKLFVEVSKQSEIKKPGITVDDLGNKVAEEVNRVIRHLQGKVD